MNKKIIGIIIIVAALIIMAVIVYVIFFYQFAPAEEQVKLSEVSQPTQPQPSPQPPTQPLATSVVTLPQPIKREVGQADLVRIAEAFAERFGSYSNQSDYSNIRDLKLFMSQNLQEWAENYIAQSLAKKVETNIYYGITTKAMGAEVKEFDSDLGRAEILVKTQRREAAGIMSNATNFAQDILIKFIRDKGAWKVDSVVWQSK